VASVTCASASIPARDRQLPAPDDFIGVRRDERVAGELVPPRASVSAATSSPRCPLHVTRAAVEVAVSDLGLERVARPAVDRLDGDGVDGRWREGSPATRAFEAGDEWTSLEAETGG
jgi:hypothetical protein